MTFNDWYREVSFLFAEAGYEAANIGWDLTSIFSEGGEPYQVLEEYEDTLNTSNFSEPA